MNIQELFEHIKSKGDLAVREYSRSLDKYTGPLDVSEVELKKAYDQVDPKILEAIDVSIKNIRSYHEEIKPRSKIWISPNGVQIERKFIPYNPVGVYVPAGRYPLFSSLLMSAIPAEIAGCKDIIVVTPPNTSPLILATAYKLGLKKVYKIGGAQAIAAMALGTETIPKCKMICGPGNQYVTAAKEYIRKTFSNVQIDLPAGPSEIAVVVDESTNAKYAAADLLSQAEHDPESRCFLIGWNKDKLQEVKDLFFRCGSELGLPFETLKNQLKMYYVKNLNQATEQIDELAPEHLSIQCHNPEIFAQTIQCAGSIFVGPWTPETLGDYVNGPSHVLPTNGYASILSGLSSDSFGKYMSIQNVSREAFSRLAPAAKLMAVSEGLRAHAYAVEVREND